MTYNDFVERVGWGEEFTFVYNSDQYWISQNKDGHYLTRIRDSFTQKFLTVPELFENGKIDDKSIIELWHYIGDQL
ncbi:MAG: hypothetical protein LBJ67_14305 [Planctomycetaceae bacterium]|jgi:hypothetical protein|nr:hypothetical protein [Planctomycetaceae bacterium]